MHIPLPASNIFNIRPSSLSDLCEDDLDTESESDASDIETDDSYTT